MMPNAVPSEAPLAFALEPARPNFSVGTMLAVRLALNRSEASWLWLFDVAGRRIARWEVGSLAAGTTQWTSPKAGGSSPALRGGPVFRDDGTPAFLAIRQGVLYRVNWAVSAKP
jgi:hypothetical protein